MFYLTTLNRAGTRHARYRMPFLLPSNDDLRFRHVVRPDATEKVIKLSLLKVPLEKLGTRSLVLAHHRYNQGYKPGARAGFETVMG